MTNDALFAIGREAGVERRHAGDYGLQSEGKAGKGGKAHHGYILGASHHVKRERRLWTNIGRCPLPVAHVLREAAMLSHPPRPYHMRMRGVKWGRMGYCMGVRCGMLTIRYKRNTCPRNTA